MKRFQVFAIAILAVMVAALVGCDNTGSELEVRRALVTYMEQPTFSGQDIYREVSGTVARFQLHNRSESKLYFIVSKKELTNEVIDGLTTNRNAVEFGKDTKLGVELGGYRVHIDNMLLRFPTDNLRIDPTWVIRKRLGRQQYTISMAELVDFVHDRTVYGGESIAQLSVQERHGRTALFANHGTKVAIKGEPSLTRLVTTVIKEGDSNEVQAQKLLDLVTMGLDYDQRESRAGFETLKRPNEVLMTGGSDCSGLVIAYASLLEQTDVDYRLLYCFNRWSGAHLTVAVAGDFKSQNGYDYKIGGQLFHLAESTVKGFRIGRTELTKSINKDYISYIQSPRDGTIWDARTGSTILWKGWLKL